jgi:hypothetical protein
MALAHDFNELDALHRECRRCGLRVFWTPGAYGSRGWLAFDRYGVPLPKMLGAGDGLEFGECTPEAGGAEQVEIVIIEWTGHPSHYPGCERIMHRWPAGGGSSPALARTEDLLPACGTRIPFWEVGTAREHTGWTWCPLCFPQRRPLSMFREYSALNRAQEQVEEKRRELRAQSDRLLAEGDKPRPKIEIELARLRSEIQKLELDRAELQIDAVRLRVDEVRASRIDENYVRSALPFKDRDAGAAAADVHEGLGEYQAFQEGRHAGRLAELGAKKEELEQRVRLLEARKTKRKKGK